MEPDLQPVAPIGSASRRRFVLTMIVAVLLTGGMSLVYWLAAKRAEADADRVSHTYAVKQELETTIRHLTDVESGARGFSLTRDEQEADVILLNTCSVRDMAEQKALGKMGMLANLRKKKPDLVFGFLGCMAQSRGGELVRDLPQVDRAMANLGSSPMAIGMDVVPTLN